MTQSTTNDPAKPGRQVLSPSSLCHVVLRTSNYKDMIDVYTTFLGGYVVLGNPFISFITYDDEHHRIAIINVPGTAPKQMKSCGLEHIAFGFSDLQGLLLSYQQRKERGVEPVWCVNHGPTTSIYYRDPDRNMLETQIDNFNTFEATNDFMNSPAFEENPIGVDFDVEELVRRLQSGEDDASLKKRLGCDVAETSNNRAPFTLSLKDSSPPESHQKVPSTPQQAHLPPSPTPHHHTALMHPK